MKTTKIEVDEHSASVLFKTCRNQLNRTQVELALMRKFCEDDTDNISRGVLRCSLPRQLANDTPEEIREQIDAWVSMVDFWTFWMNEFEKAI